MGLADNAERQAMAAKAKTQAAIIADKKATSAIVAQKAQAKVHAALVADKKATSAIIAQQVAKQQGTQTLSVPSNAPAPDFSRGTYAVVPNTPTNKPATNKPKPKPKPGTSVPPPVVNKPRPPSNPPVSPTPPSSGGGSGGSSGGGNSGGGGSSGGGSASSSTTPIKSAPIDTVIFNDDAIPNEIIADLLFEDIGGQELLTILRYDTVNGQNVIYQPIKNLNIIQQEYNPNNLLRLQQTSSSIFDAFAINLSDKIPFVGNGPNGKNIYLDETTGDIIIEFINIQQGEEVEVQIGISGTIYEAGI